MRTTSSFEDLLQLAIFHHLLHNVQSADKLSVYNELGERRPIVVHLETSAYAFVRQDVKVRELDTLVVEKADNSAREAASRGVRAALHEQDHFVLLHKADETLVELFL